MVLPRQEKVGILPINVEGLMHLNNVQINLALWSVFSTFAD
jgi:hypothetical protein